MIGKIIAKQRIKKKMTRKELSEDICSEKYIYLIEKEERNPSAYILDKLSDRLGIDLFEYYQYSNFKNNLLVVEHRRKFEKYMQLGDLSKLRDESIKASTLEDFKVEPLSYDITLINLLYEGLCEGKINQTITVLNRILETDKLNIDGLTLINAYIVLSSCYQLNGQFEKAREVLKVAYTLVEDKKNFSRYNTVIINFLISFTSFLYNNGNYDDLIQYSLELLEFQEEINEYTRIYYANFFLAFGYYRKKNLAKSKEHFMSALHSLLLFKNKMDISIIMKMEDFKIIVDELGIENVYIQKLSKIIK